MGFHEQIEKQLQLLNREQLCLFAWLSALRALPILSVGRSFCYWEQEKQQQHLYNVFYALDACAAGWNLQKDHLMNYTAAAAYGAAAAKNAAEAAARTTEAKLNKNDSWIAWTASDAASAAAWAAKTASITQANQAAAINAAAWAFRASTFGGKANDISRFASDSAFWELQAFTRIGTVDIFGKTIDNHIRVIFSEIDAIKNNDLAALNKDPTIYGSVWKNSLEDVKKSNIYGVIWHNFLEDLESVSCGYWARLYKNLFKNKSITRDKFIFDEQELLRRLFQIPEEIRAKGAAAVGHYIENETTAT
ncbi:MAG: hypothetical protein FWG61_08220 [Firmicutes bacterium]|nr:hypothetical protein [Bacillota bacterium]